MGYDPQESLEKTNTIPWGPHVRIRGTLPSLSQAPLVGRERGGSDDHSTLARVTERSIHRSGQKRTPETGG